jgi:hypothetical protein
MPTQALAVEYPPGAGIDQEQIDPLALGGAHLDAMVVRHIEEDVVVAVLADGPAQLAVGQQA